VPDRQTPHRVRRPDHEVLILGAEDPNGYAGLWSITAQLVCLSPITGRKVLFAMVPMDSTDTKSVTVTCPAGQTVHGAGASGGGGVSEGKWLLKSMVPNATLTAVTVTGEEIDGGTTTNWYLSASAVCAPRG
jgi:hypothetical protein